MPSCCYSCIKEHLPFIQKFWWKISVKWLWYFLGPPKTGTELSCTIYKILVNFSLSLDLNPGTGNPNGTENFSRFGKNRKKVTPQKVLLIFCKISTGMNRSIWILPRIPGFSIQMVSVQTLFLNSIINPLSPNSDQHQFSPNNIHMLPREMVTRINQMITKKKKLGSFIKLSQLISKEMYEYQSGEFVCG